MNSWSDSSLNSLNGLLQWIAPACTGITVFAAICLILVKTELGRRQNTVLAQLKLETAQANAKAEESRVKYLELLGRVMPRQIAGERRAKFLSLLKDAPIAKVRVSYAEQDREARAFADQIVAALEELHWTVSGHEPIPENRGVPHPIEDLVFDVPASGPLPASLQPLRDALAEIGFSSGTRDLGSADGMIDLFIGSKRPRE